MNQTIIARMPVATNGTAGTNTIGENDHGGPPTKRSFHNSALSGTGGSEYGLAKASTGSSSILSLGLDASSASCHSDSAGGGRSGSGGCGGGGMGPNPITSCSRKHTTANTRHNAVTTRWAIASRPRSCTEMTRSPACRASCNTKGKPLKDATQQNVVGKMIAYDVITATATVRHTTESSKQMLPMLRMLSIVLAILPAISSMSMPPQNWTRHKTGKPARTKPNRWMMRDVSLPRTISVSLNCVEKSNSNVWRSLSSAIALPR